MIVRFNSLYAKILIGMSGLILLVGVALVVLVETTVQRKLHEALEKRGAFIAREIASEAATPLLTEHLVELELLFRDIMEMDKEIIYIFVQDPKGKVRVHSFGKTFPTDLRDLGTVPAGIHFLVQRLETGQGLVLDFAAPVMQGRIGTVHVGMTEAPLRQEVSAILRQLILLIVLVLVLGSGIAVAIARAITRPLQELVQAAGAVGSGDLDHQITVRTGDEIGVLADSFRAMVAKRKQAEQGREELISELQEALDNVKKLEGMLPICSSCKRIRDDKGDWNELEEYIHDHSEAEFSHGLCQDCARKIYPKYFSKEEDPSHDG